MKTRTVQLAAIAGIVVATVLIATPWVFAATSTAPTTTPSPGSTTAAISNTIGTQGRTTWQQGPGFEGGTSHQPGAGPPGRSFGMPSAANLTVGQTITVTSSRGSYYVVGTPSSNGTAWGTITFAVTSKLSGGYTLSITSGSIVVGGTTYTISSGTAQTGPSADVISGQGTTTPTGQFLLQGYARGTFAGTTSQLVLDFKAGSTEYAVTLTGTVQS
jgi:hypothetical protein